MPICPEWEQIGHNVAVILEPQRWLQLRSGADDTASISVGIVGKKSSPSARCRLRKPRAKQRRLITCRCGLSNSGSNCRPASISLRSRLSKLTRMLVTNVDFEGGSVTRREKKRVKGKLSTRRLGFAAPIWMTFNQANELKSNVRKGSKGSLVVYADRITKTEIAEHGEETDRDIYFMNVSGR